MRYNFLDFFVIYFSVKVNFKKCMKYFEFVKIDYSFFLLLVLALFLDTIFTYFLYVVFIILHEICHLLVARRLGYLPKKLKLTMFGASLEGFDDFLLGDEIKIVLAGPLFNFFIVITCYLLFWFYPESYEFLNVILFVNESILFFNLLPIFPLDAGRLVLCFASMKKGRNHGLKFVKKLSLILVLLLFGVSVFSIFFVFNFALGFASINLCLLLFQSSSGTSYKREILLRRKIKRLAKGIPEKCVFVFKDYPKKLLLKFIDAEHYFTFVFVDENFKEIDRISERGLLEDLGFI